ncbi:MULTISPECIES: tRNA (adenosine(37)-N6)-threonylcarbamoyltransferase complex dimerization subunit type 1 TsaB [unclassified Bartonella]|uniref:tRNA (adenosine(37)-N6)-threonylcarbamoyltransferase complex dimerization subunit type 1 TsaB n=1 Tax=unclassified Bartonella TaxID=2645622 RepID=UPI0015F882A9|nr:MULTISPECIES: tRNA (adenosine(37)-N6)-threonylcarbamoyltransferase complex dimerization subunit type 1 TsaB [unclassified Bartonella]UXN03952.1 tRNA (adenosine(37)-N6)-threonylcarbamoyltransferase complex dimerization subunit type 1 TsaB [Bartonella sp. HY406]UXN06935.1 tRNA (adenosine(37)-N6)-threonylcarbamoyltransferase complex dimerization subunit type 1 TsaB [Bartonella sp. HY761]
MTLLIIDTATRLSATALFDGDTCLTFDTNPLEKSPAEHLMQQISTIMQKANKSFSDIDRIIVNTGPGSFTGIRIGVSAARGFGLALDKPVIGISLLEAKAFALRNEQYAISIIEEGHGGTLMAQHFNAAGNILTPAYTANADDIRKNLMGEILLSGSGAANIKSPLIAARKSPPYFEILQSLAVLGANKSPENALPTPVYMRPPDAKPQIGFALPRI